MMRFYHARWHAYKGVLILAAIAVPVLYYFILMERGGLGDSTHAFFVIHPRAVLQWSLGWYLILFGDGSFGSFPPTSLRPCYVIPGICLLALPIVSVLPYYF